MTSIASMENNLKDTSLQENDLPEEFAKRAERNRQKALLLKKSKIVSHPYAKIDNSESSTGKSIKIQGQRVIDSGAGFLIDENEDLEEEMLKIVDVPAPIVSGLPTCDECKAEFKDSFLLQKFDYSVCDACRDNNEKHTLITKSEAKQEYLLKDCDFDKRQPSLKFIMRQNPHNPRWGDMKLYLQLQVEKRAVEVWGSEENLLKERELRDEKREEAKIKKFNTKIKKLRMEVRSSLYDKTRKASHVHKFGPESYDEVEDTYSQTCTTCGYENTYEKM
ncbi:DNA repair protein complementing XP-A cells homolog [Belonocnema kinseyi]|uniref:DNA repair protein complementing XP-A cells homolog n=1 Tax=Belonocnema kinseyi TaxID=2817044 RepID=UPI00143D9FE9|nr:DNA repair protein complementing XP-A cells homolog [Belonocnema kinseyi]